jgi:hypothetical protein
VAPPPAGIEYSDGGASSNADNVPGPCGGGCRQQEQGKRQGPRKCFCSGFDFCYLVTNWASHLCRRPWFRPASVRAPLGRDSS